MTQMKITLDNCDKEPIHTPGFIQPHGALLAFDYSGHLLYFSANASEVLGGLPSATLVESDFQNIAGAALHILNYLQDAKNGDSILLTYFVDQGPLKVLRNRAKRFGNFLLNEIRNRT